MDGLIIRKGKKEDLAEVLGLIKELAIYEKEPDAVICTVETMEKDGFGNNAIFEFFVAEKDGQILGTALFYFKYSTWKGRCLYLEDIVVSEDHRNKGIGSKLFKAVKEVAQNLKLKRMEWQVLEWNEPAINFYKKHKALVDPEWLNVKFEWE